MGGRGKRDVGREFDRESLIRATRRLSRHLSSHLAGDFAAIDDVAALLRTLCAKGAGNRLIQRVVNAYGLDVPPLWISDAVQPKAGTVLDIGGLPSLGPQGHSEQKISFLEWLDTPAIVSARDFDAPYPGNVARHSSAQLLNELANVRGAHATQTIADWLDTTSMGGVHELTLADFVIEYVAAVVEDVLRGLLTQLGEAEHAPPVRLLPLRATGVTRLAVETVPMSSILGGNTTIHAHGFTAGPGRVPVGRHPVVRLTVRGVTFGIDALMRADGSAQYERV